MKIIFAQKLRELRLNAGLNQRELAEQIGIGKVFVSKVETGQSPVKRADLIKISRICNFPIEELESFWLAEKVYLMVKNEASALAALKIVEEQLKNKSTKNE